MISQQPSANPCTITGIVGSRVLNCNFGTILPGSSVTVTVSTPTQTTDPGDCGRPLTLANTATVVGSPNLGPLSDSASVTCDKPADAVPTMSNLGLLMMMLMFGATGCAILRRRLDR